MKLLTSLAGLGATVVTAALLVAPTPRFTPAADAAPVAGCVSGPAAQAAVRLYGAGSSVRSHDRVEGLDTALVLEPLIHPGVRHRMIAADGRWCDATTGLNSAWELLGRDLSASRAIVRAYTRLAAAPYFDQVDVRSATGTPAGLWTVRTHALTNGVDATWVVATDAEGVRTARWVATGFAKKPFTAQWEGLTALPEATETYTRLTTGLLREERGLPTAASAASAALDDSPSLSSQTFADGFTITVAVGDTHVGVDPGVDTGIQQADIVRETMSAARINYRDFLAWGLKKNWETIPPLDGDTGYIAINDALSAYCLACVFNSSDFNVHMLSEARLALAALGYDGYSDAKAAWDLIIGHEMFHNFQNGHSNPGTPGENLFSGRFTSTAYSEGTARFQESLHDYASVGYAPGTLATATDANGCNGFDDGGPMDTAMARGPFDVALTYNACYFWGPWYVTNGKAALLRLITKAMPAHAAEDGYAEIAPAVVAAARRPLGVQLAEFAAASITGHGRAWETWSGKKRYDWNRYFDYWEPARLKPGGATEVLLGAAGIMARRVTDPLRVSLGGDRAAELYVVTDRRNGARITVVPSGRVVVRPAGDRTYVVVVRPADGERQVTLAARRP